MIAIIDKGSHNAAPGETEGGIDKVCTIERAENFPSLFQKLYEVARREEILIDELRGAFERNDGEAALRIAGQLTASRTDHKA